MRGRLVIGGLVVVAAVTAATTAAAPAPEVTLTAQRFYDSGSRFWKLRFAGTISSGAANEYVAVLGQACGGSSGFTSVAGASTRPGGAWDVETGFISISPPATYRARWNNAESDPVTIRPPIQVFGPSRFGPDRRRYRVFVYAQPPLDLSRRVVQLQRLASGRWVRVRTARLKRTLRVAGNFEADFVVRTRRLRLRVLVPDQTAGPCYRMGVSQAWTS